MQPIEFWFSIGSTYTYLSVARMEELEAEHGVRFTLHPFSVRVLMREMGNVPFIGKPAKAAYMWRDIERRAAELGLPATLPAPYPLEEFDLANLVAVLGAEEGWIREYLLETYRRWFVDGQPAGSDPNLTDSLHAIGQDPARVVAEAQADETQARYTAATDAARAHGIFGAPSFLVGGELFWGDDRMEAAIRAAKAG